MLKKRRTNAVYQIGVGLLASIREALVAEFIQMRFGIKTTDVGADDILVGIDDFGPGDINTPTGADKSYLPA